MFPTPTGRCHTGSSETDTREGSPDLQTTVGGQLNPDWVEWLMGLPPGWTDPDMDVAVPRPPKSWRWPDESPIPRISVGVKNRVSRLQALGNGVVPQWAFPIFAAIAEIEMERVT